jgi:hypothetical protein
MLGDGLQEVLLMDEILNIIQVFRGNGQHGGKFIFLNPAAIVALQPLDIFIGEVLFELSAPSGDALLDRAKRAGEIDEKIRWIDDLEHDFIQVAVGAPLVLGHGSLAVQVIGEYLGVLVDGSILNNRTGKGIQLAVDAKFMCQKVHLGVEGPALHVLEKESQKRIEVIGFEERLETKVFTQEIH